jgi:hypothetical protein
VAGPNHHDKGGPLMMATTNLSQNRTTQRLLMHRLAVATLARQAARKAVKRQLQADGIKPYTRHAELVLADAATNRSSCEASVCSPSAHASPCLRIQARQRWARHSVAGALSWSSQSAINTTQREPKAGSHNSGKADAKRARREHAGPPVWPLHHNRTSGPCPIMAMERNLGRFAS